jgi:hypothetical protein
MLETGADAFLFTASTAGEKNRYFMLLNSPQTPSASGLKAGSILCADSYDYANPGKNDLVVKGTASIGFNGPGTNKLSVNGTVFAQTGFVNGSKSKPYRMLSTLSSICAVCGLSGRSATSRR